MTILTDTPVAGIDDQPNNNNKLMVALDVDGTLVDHDGHMSPAVRSAAQAVVASGHDVMIATGRSLNATLPIIKQIGLERGYAVCCNGGVTLRLDPALETGYQIIHKATFDPAPALKALRERLPNAKYALEDEDGNFLSTERFQDASFGVESIGVDFQTMLDATAVRVVVFSSENTSDEFNEAIRHIGLSGVTYSVGWTAWLDIAAEGVTKASALEALRQKLGTNVSNTVAVGDGRNDIEMLTWAGRGVAMGQAPDEVIAVADEVTASVLDDGAALVLRGLL
ncbi:HAD family hydrolase [Paenarthrobacter nitroguajacolicus]|uniref:HAD family hydrolase n=1 Tax=Paenarthrobacter nitroguajacolicus TaxID=211146 RepID=UPI0028662114|nr:HAD family hydrolase [Paenarthrobacter nitroguajacolicus]MDR6638734.1 Cof subfamily protein (haloacid dehalogenase superfamily) [Paenarthrobacter nitroguajacolicus]